jgi:hypothetical protein
MENKEIIINLITIGSRCPIMKKRTFDNEYKISDFIVIDSGKSVSCF